MAIGITLCGGLIKTNDPEKYVMLTHAVSHGWTGATTQYYPMYDGQSADPYFVPAGKRLRLIGMWSLAAASGPNFTASFGAATAVTGTGYTPWPETLSNYILKGGGLQAIGGLKTYIHGVTVPAGNCVLMKSVSNSGDWYYIGGILEMWGILEDVT